MATQWTIITAEGVYRIRRTGGTTHVHVAMSTYSFLLVRPDGTELGFRGETRLVSIDTEIREDHEFAASLEMTEPERSFAFAFLKNSYLTALRCWLVEEAPQLGCEVVWYTSRSRVNSQTIWYGGLARGAGGEFLVVYPDYNPHPSWGMSPAPYGNNKPDGVTAYVEVDRETWYNLAEILSLAVQ